ncbi:MAG: hypothetical protein IIB05_05955 [Bacteroidetes bacterium]|nr:hypothetical protein [Bacteroidota bacterium]
MKKKIATEVLVFIFLFSGINELFSIPAFSRKYKTSCVTCHSSFPKLNPFGEAFRYNGYKFPVNDEDNVKEEPIILGAEAYKMVWPKAVWPGSLPGTTPIAFRGRTGFTIGNEGDSLLFSEFGKPTLQLMASGVLSEGISFFIGAHLYEEGKMGNIDRFFIRFNNLFKNFLPEKSLNIRVGQFIPDIVPFASNHRGITNSAYAFNTYAPELGTGFVAGHVHGGGPFGIENFQLGAEASGIVKSRFRYVAGLVNGNGTEDDDNSFRDLYGRLSFKLGGMAFDGTFRDGVTDIETSITLGVFAYKGIKTINSYDIDFHRLGFDANIYLNKLNLVGGFITGSDGNQDKDKYNLFFTEANYAFYPWLTGLLRYEQANPKGKESAKQLVPHISALTVANVRLKLETRLDISDIKFNNLYFGLDFAF